MREHTGSDNYQRRWRWRVQVRHCGLLSRLFLLYNLFAELSRCCALTSTSAFAVGAPEALYEDQLMKLTPGMFCAQSGVFRNQRSVAFLTASSSAYGSASTACNSFTSEKSLSFSALR
mmetsp:Transcript_33994/g.57629  ORF Transcript_33994/g.57629 Transcript_33994/m.57629 type:complete len:118 (+) Transcript_33994:336-689(+)